MYELQEPTSVSYLLHSLKWSLSTSALSLRLWCLMVLLLRPRASVTRDQPPCHLLQLCPATLPRTTARQRTTMTSAMTRIWRQRRTGWTSASPTLCHSKTSLLLCTGPMESPTVSQARKTETRGCTHTQYMLNLTSETWSVANVKSPPCAQKLNKWVQLCESEW